MPPTFALYSFDKSLRKTLNKGCAWHQLLILAMFELSYFRAAFLQYFSSLLYSMPDHVLCGTEKCSIEEACEAHKGYKYDFDDPDYIDNWVRQYDLLCE